MKRVTFGEPVHIIPSIQFRILKMGNSTSVVTVGKRAESEYSYYGVNKGRKSMAKCMGRIAAIALIGMVFLLIPLKVHSEVLTHRKGDVICVDKGWLFCLLQFSCF